MSARRDYYAVLEVPRDVTAEALKKSYRRLAMKYHPDQNPGDASAAEKFKELTEAYQVLADPERRARYDQFGSDAPTGFDGGMNPMDMGSMTDFFESVFGSVFGAPPRRRRQSGQPGRNLQYELTITLEQAVLGATLEIAVPRPVRCTECQGSGAKSGTKAERCPHCHGQGSIRLQQGIFAMATTCPSCGGRGEVVREACPTCEGRGLTTREEELEVQIPAGIDDGAVKVIPGLGEDGRGGAPAGDLHVLVRVERHRFFVRKGLDLHCVVRISFPQAVLGAEITVPLIEGQATMQIKPGTEPDQVYRLRGRGVTALRGGHRGDQLVHIEIAVPKKVTARQRELVEELGRELGDAVQPRRSTSLVDKLKSLFE